MALGTTFNLPNYVGDLFSITPQDTPFVSAIGGLTGGEKAKSTRFGWQFYDLRSADATRQKVEGADAPAGEQRARQADYNVVEVHQEAVEVSYTKQAATNLIDHAGQGGGVEGTNPVTNEFDWQIDKQLKQIARDIEVSFISGTFNDPADNTQPRRTKGLLEAIVTNVVTADGTGTGVDPAPLTLDLLNDVAQAAYDNGGLSEGDTATIMLGSTQKRALSAAAREAGLTEPASRTVGGVNVQTIETDFGTLNVMLNRYMPADELVVVSLEECAPVFLEIPGKGFLFVEPLAKTGASERAQIYGEVGLKFGNERKHGKILNLA